MYSQRDFYHTVLATEGKPCLARLVTGGERAYFKHEVFANVDEFCDALDKIDFTKFNYYFAISTLKEYSIGKRVRTQENAMLTRSFVLDIDVRDKPGHYKTMEEALAGVQTVVDAFSLPQPIIVNSGFGYHVYWPMADGVDSPTWKKVAEQFKKAVGLIAPEVVADGSRVADTAGVLRVPNSFNLKGGVNTPVEIIQWYSDFLDFGEFSAQLDRIVGTAPDKVKTNIKAPIVEQGPGDLAKVAKNCNWVKHYLTHRAEASEPEWYAMLGLVPYLIYTKDNVEISGPKLAHAISKGHPNYDPQATYDKYMQAKAGQTGPTTCARLQAIDPKRCEGCPFASTVKSPVQTSGLARPATEAVTVETLTQDDSGTTSRETVTIPLPPKPYFRGESGGVYVRVKQQMDDGSWDEHIEKVYDYDVYPTKRFRTESVENELMEVHLWLPKDGLRKFKLPNGLLADNKSLNRFLSDKGVVAEHGKNGRLTRFLIDYVRHLQMTQAAEVEFSRFGWRETFSNEPKFVVGDGYLTKDGTLHPSSYADFLGSKAVNAVSTSGTLEKWKEGFNIYNGVPDSEAYILAALIGFASPLMPLTEYSGVLYNINGHSGGGKSTALKVMTSTWGEPSSNHLLPKDTEISTFNFIGYLNNIPVSFDELTNMEGDALSDFCLSFTSGRGKMRAGRDGQNRINETQWGTIVCSTSNTSLYDKLAAYRKGYNAEAMRIFELQVHDADIKYAPHIDRHMALLKENYGHAGREFVKYIMPRLPQVKQLIEKATAVVNAKGNLRNEERFWGALLACVLVGGKIARDVLKLHTYDVDAVVNWALGLSEGVRATVQSSISDPVSVLAEFFNSNLDSLLRIKDGRPNLSGMQNSMRSVKARLEYEGDVLATAYVSIAAIRDYCRVKNVDAAWLRTELLAAGIITRDQQKRLTSGTDLPNVSLKTWVIDLTNPKLLEAINLPEETEPTDEQPNS